MPDPSAADRLRIASRFLQENKLVDAEKVCRQALRSAPSNLEARQMLAFICHRLDRSQEAIDLLQQVIDAVPKRPHAHNNMGEVYRAMKRFDEAAACYGRALALDPGFADAHCNLGILHELQGRSNEALSSLQSALHFAPGLPPAHNNLGNVLARLGRNQEAVTAYEAALKRAPNYLEAHDNFARLLNKLGRSSEAITHYLRALDLSPTFVPARIGLGVALGAQGRVSEGLVHHKAALALDPSNAQLHSDILLGSMYLEIAPERLLEEHLQWAARHAAPFAPSITPRSDRTPRDRAGAPGDRPLRIGYVSGDFRLHSVQFFLEPVLANRDRARFHVVCYASVQQPDEMTARFRELADEWRDIVGMSDEEAAAAVRADAIDILVDLTGHTANSRLGVFARKPAPVQVTYLGYPSTTGLAEIDYRISDAYADPVNEPSHGTEALVRLPETFLCYAPPSVSPAVSALPARTKGYVTFGCFNNFAKVNDALLVSWSKLLARVPGSRIVLKAPGLGDAGVGARVRSIFAAHGVDSSRIEMLGWRGFEQHLALYGEIDIGLDSFPYHGTTTTCEAMWMGVPVVTRSGSRHASRVGVSLLNNVGTADLIATTVDGYVDIAANLALDLDRLARLRGELRQKMATSPLCLAERFTRNLEDAYRQMWSQGRSAGVAPIAAG